MDSNLESIIGKYSFSGHVFCRPNIPNDKASNAIAAYAQEINYADIVILVDETVFGGAKDGLILSEKGLFAHEIWQQRVMVPIQDIESIRIDDKKLVVNGEKFFQFNVVDKKDRPPLVELLAKLKDALTGNIEALGAERQEKPNDECNQPACSSNEGSVTVSDQGSNTHVAVQSTDQQNVVGKDQDKLPLDKKELEKIFSRFKYDYHKLYFAPKIPNGPLTKAINNYAKDVVDKESTIVLLDISYGPDSTDGVLVTSNKLYSKWGPHFHEFKLSEIKTISVAPSPFDYAVYINGEEAFDIHPMGELSIPDIKRLIYMVGVLIDYINGVLLTDEQRSARDYYKQICKIREYVFLGAYMDSSNMDSWDRYLLDNADKYSHLSVRDVNALDNNSNHIDPEPFYVFRQQIINTAFGFSRTVPNTVTDRSLNVLLKSDYVIFELLMIIAFKSIYMLLSSIKNKEILDKSLRYVVFTFENLIFGLYFSFQFYIKDIEVESRSLNSIGQEDNIEALFGKVFDDRKSIYYSEDEDCINDYSSAFALILLAMRRDKFDLKYFSDSAKITSDVDIAFLLKDIPEQEKFIADNQERLKECLTTYIDNLEQVIEPYLFDFIKKALKV